MISETADCTDWGEGTSSRIHAAVAAASSPAVSDRRSHRIEALQEGVELTCLQLVRDTVGDQPRRARSDLLADDEPVLAERRSRRGEVDDPLDEPGQRRELHRALHLDDLRLATRLL